MKLRSIRTIWLLPLLITLAVVLNILVFTIPYFDPIKAVLGFAWLFLAPGWFIAQIIRLKTPSHGEYVGFIVGFSTLATMLTTLLINTTLMLLGNPHPLDAPNLMIGTDIAWSALLAGALWRHRAGLPSQRISLPQAIPNPPWLLTLGALIPVALAILGANSLNNHGTNLFTVGLLLYLAAYLGYLVTRRSQFSENALVLALYGTALALLFMTSLRGWTTTGHDVQAEYHVFLLTLNHLSWNMANLRDAYNACLSITVLPTIVHQITGINEGYVYKIVFQMIFALVPGMVYLIARNYASRLVSLLAAIYFMAFPTFFGDMPMLNRQEIAFVFLGLIFLTIFNADWRLGQKRWLIATLSLGVVLSHYSTTYTMIAMFAIFLALSTSLKFITNHLDSSRQRLHLFLARWRKPKPSPISLWVIAMLLASSYIWSIQLTGTGGNLARVALGTVQSIRTGIAGENRSSDTSYSLLAKTHATTQQRLDGYLQQSVPQDRAKADPATLYPTQTYAPYPVKAATDENLALTPIGQRLSAAGINVPALNALIRQSSAALLQLVLIVGILLLFIGYRFAGHITRRHYTEYQLFALSTICILAMIVLLPVISAEYGLLRAFQQMLLVSGSAIALATIALVPARYRRARQIIPSALAIAFLLSSTGVFTTLLGGYPGQLHLANSGKYYDLYYPHASEERAADWLESTNTIFYHRGNGGSGIYADQPTYAKIQSFTSLSLKGGLYPGLIKRNAYVFLGYTNVTKQQALLSVDGDVITYQYPLQFLDDQKDLLYSSQTTRIYR
ncbi:MAG TPA: DUF2206 domain-containing protein [Candidatus Saccharimonadia bacterium]|nr:DUF2206 domain-containing protein [Candidatus Saccharimonadia bacterium]